MWTLQATLFAMKPGQVRLPSSEESSVDDRESPQVAAHI